MKRENTAQTIGSAWGDLDTDGKLMVNTGTFHRWLKIRLEGDAVSVDRNAIGTRVQIEIPGKTLVRQVEAGTGERNQNHAVLHFCLGDHAGPLDVNVMWLDGSQANYQDVPADQFITISYTGGLIP